MKLNYDAVLWILIMAVIAMAALLLIVTVSTSHEIRCIKETVERNEMLTEMRYESLESRIEAIEEGLK